MLEYQVMLQIKDNWELWVGPGVCLPTVLCLSVVSPPFIYKFCVSAYSSLVGRIAKNSKG